MYSKKYNNECILYEKMYRKKVASMYNQECYEYAFLTDVLSMLCRGMSFAGIVMVRTKNHRNELRRDPSFLFDM